MTAESATERRDRTELSLIELTRRFPDEAAAQAWFETQRWPDGAACPRCGNHNVHRVQHARPMPWHCPSCRKYFSVRTGTVMANSRLPLQKWAFAIFTISTAPKGVSSTKLQRDLGISQKSAWFLAHRIREALEVKGWIFTGTVEVDETYFGGKERNKHSNKRHRRGGTFGKLPVVGLRERSSGHVYAEPIDNASGAELVPFVERHTTPETRVYADEYPAYNALQRRVETVAHSRGEYVRDDVSTNGIESFWAEVKRSYNGTHHWWSRKHLARYIHERVWYHNTRRLDVIDVMADIARRLVGRSLTYEELTRGER